MWGLAVLGCVLGLASRPPSGAHGGVGLQALDLVRVLSTTALVVVLVLGPGLVLRAAHPRFPISLGFVPLPGLAVLAFCGAVAWALAREIHPRIVCVLLPLAVLGWMVLRVARLGTREIVTAEERWALLVIAGALGVAIARTLWSLGPPGELLAGTTFRTLEVGDRSDSRVSFGVVQLIASGSSPFGAAARGYFQGYTFSDRGPLAGLASAPILLLTGGRPPASASGGPWSPFDPQGFLAYRLSMMTFASTAFLSVWTLTRRVGGRRSARLALLLAATTPFLVHEVWFTWPKLLAASLVLLAAVSLLDGRPLLSGLLVGAGYLVHPLALLSVPTLCLLALWPPACAATVLPASAARLRHLRIPPVRIRGAIALLAGVAVCLVVWRVANGSHYTQTGFLHDLTRAGRTRTLAASFVRAFGGHPAPVTVSAWLSDRLVSVANTLVPLRLFFLSANDPSINAVNPACSPFCTGHSPAIVHFFFQYWTAVPFAFGIVFLPLLLLGLWRSARRWPWLVTATVIVPFLLFAVYWGDADTGLLREGLHAWVLTLLVLLALEQGSERFPWLRNGPAVALLALRSVEVLLVAMLPTVLTTHRLIDSRFALTDVVAVIAMIVLCGWLGSLVWRERVAPERARAL
jgi:hypothetical protein